MCSVCRVILRPQVFQDVMRGEETLTCDSCQRIMYYVPPPPKPPETEAEAKVKSRKAKAGVEPLEEEEPAQADEAAAQ